MTDQSLVQPAPDSLPAAMPQTRLNGVVDVLRPNRIAGWAIDRSDSSASVTVDILRDGRPYCSVVANRHRPDLEGSGIGTGHYGFSAEIAPPLELGFEFTISAIARAADGETLKLRAVGGARHEVPADLRLLHQILTRLEETRPAEAAAAPDRAVIQEMLARIEVVQARCEAALARLEAVPTAAPDSRFRGLVYTAAALSVLSLALGIASFWTG